MSDPGEEQQPDPRTRTLAAIDRLAVNPAPVVAVLDADPDDPDALIGALARCPVLAARVIGVANSAGSTAIHRMDTVERCVRHLGAKQARTVALTLAMQLLASDLGVDQGLLDALWGSATTKAVAASLTAECIMPDTAERAYCQGLLQDIALPVLAALDPGIYASEQPVDRDAQSWLERERDAFGIDHAELGGLLLKRWGVPAALADRVHQHHAALSIDNDSDDAACAESIANHLAGLLPHPGQTPSNEQSCRLAALHARFLAGTHPTIDSVLNTVRARVKAMGKAAGGPAPYGPELLERIAGAVAADTFALVAQVGRLDRQLSQQVDHLADLQRDALTDTLTGLLNRRGFERFAGQMLAQARKTGQPVMCAVVDLDDFKPINDSFGHAAGDTVIRTAADLLRTNLASGDLVARLGGDEFVILVVGAPQGDARALIERVHAACNGRRVAVGQGQRATLRMSIGGLYLHGVGQGLGPGELLDAADRLMYHCKQNGKAGITFQATKAAA